LSGFVIDQSDAALESELAVIGVKVAMTNTIMHSRQDKRALARFVLDLAGVI
jgi:hypothetical protein